jgi:hypothetical protein
VDEADLVRVSSKGEKHHILPVDEVEGYGYVITGQLEYA